MTNVSTKSETLWSGPCLHILTNRSSQAANCTYNVPYSSTSPRRGRSRRAPQRSQSVVAPTIHMDTTSGLAIAFSPCVSECIQSLLRSGNTITLHVGSIRSCHGRPACQIYSRKRDAYGTVCLTAVCARFSRHMFHQLWRRKKNTARVIRTGKKLPNAECMERASCPLQAPTSQRTPGPA